ncbi:MAG: flippase-like domain-containing protein [candidate division Zixibacteria bacterium]|nr:flippase-like domain-containing protein [candidate division Zixibacteria bacterium]
MPKKKLWSFLIGIAISVICLYLIFRNVDFPELLTALKQANYIWIIPNIFFVVFAMYQRAERWKFMVRPIASPSYRKLLAATCIGFMANNVLPLRLGEFVRAYSLSTQEPKITKSASLATIFVERMVFDLLALLLILAVILLIVPIPVDEHFKLGAMLSLVIAIVGLVFAVVIVLKPEGSGRLLTKYLFFLPDSIKAKIQNTVLKFSKGLLFLKDWRQTAWVTAHTIFLWLFMGISNIFIFYAFGFDLPIYASYVLLVVVSISILIPSSPGFIGVYHGGVIWTLHFFNIEQSSAISCAIVLHAAQFLPITLLGFYYLKKEHLSLKQLQKEALDSNQNHVKQ